MPLPRGRPTPNWCRPIYARQRPKRIWRRSSTDRCSPPRGSRQKRRPTYLLQFPVPAEALVIGLPSARLSDHTTTFFAFLAIVVLAVVLALLFSVICHVHSRSDDAPPSSEHVSVHVPPLLPPIEH